MGSITGIVHDLNEFDWRELTEPEAMGAWPAAVKACVLVLLVVVLLASGYLLFLRGLQQRDERLELEAAVLGTELERLAANAAELEQYREWARDNEAPYMQMLRQLPYESEIPALIDEITALGHGFGLEFKSIGLPAERESLHYVEQLIEIRVAGNYHDLGAFLGGLATLDRIVSSHDFVLGKASDGGLELVLQASSYRYRPLPAAEAATEAGANADSLRLPELGPRVQFRYAAGTGRDPFAGLASSGVTGPGQERDDSWPLAKYAVNELRLVGLLQQGHKRSGLVLDPAGTVHRVYPGDHFGRNRGLIEQISRLGIVLVESGRNDSGASGPREVLLVWEED